MTRRTVVLVERRTREARLRPADAAFLRDRFRGVVDVNPGAGADRYRLAARGVAGTIDAPHARLLIRPKLPWPNLRVLLGLDPAAFAAGAPHDPAADLLVVLATEFAARLRDVTAIGPVRGYREADRAAPYLRGRLRTADQLRDAATRAFPTVFHITESAFDLDVPWNQIPKAVADTLLNHPGLPADARAAVAAAAAPLEGITPATPTDELFAAAEREPRIEYIDMPDALRGRYQYFTQARMERLREAGWTEPATSLEEGVGDYVSGYLAAADLYR